MPTGTEAAEVPVLQCGDFIREMHRRLSHEREYDPAPPFLCHRQRLHRIVRVALVSVKKVLCIKDNFLAVRF